MYTNKCNSSLKITENMMGTRTNKYCHVLFKRTKGEMTSWTLLYGSPFYGDGYRWHAGWKPSSQQYPLGPLTHHHWWHVVEKGAPVIAATRFLRCLSSFYLSSTNTLNYSTFLLFFFLSMIVAQFILFLSMTILLFCLLPLKKKKFLGLPA